MREIKFRGKRIDNGEWVYGYYSLKKIVLDDDREINWNCAILKECPNNGTYYRFESIEVVPETVGQYTELKDRNGNEIYEGDIVLYYHNQDKEDKRTIRYKSVIEWSEGGLFSKRLNKSEFWSKKSRKMTLSNA